MNKQTNQVHRYDYVKEQFEQRGFTLVSTEYKNLESPLEFFCVCGASRSITFNTLLRRGAGKCKSCRLYKVNDGLAKLHQDKREAAIYKFSSFAKENGCEFLELIKIKKYNKVKFRCGCGEEHSRATTDFYKHPKCVECEKKNTKKIRGDDGTGLLPLHIRQFFKENGTPLVDESARSLMELLEFYCKCGDIGSKRWYYFKKTPKCIKCSKKGSGFQYKDRHFNWIENRELKELHDKFRLDCTQVLNRMYDSDSDEIIDIVGYSGKELKQYIVNHPNYIEDFYFDHIFPLTAFTDHNILDIKLANHLSNIQPLSRTENAKKYNKYDRKEFFKWLITVL